MGTSEREVRGAALDHSDGQDPLYQQSPADLRAAIAMLAGLDSYDAGREYFQRPERLRIAQHVTDHPDLDLLALDSPGLSDAIRDAVDVPDADRGGGARLTKPTLVRVARELEKPSTGGPVDD